MDLLKRRSAIAQHFLVSFASGKHGSPAAALAIDDTKGRARLVGDLALHLFGAAAFNELGADLENYDTVKNRLASFATEERWFKSLDAAGRRSAPASSACPRPWTGCWMKPSSAGLSPAGRSLSARIAWRVMPMRAASWLARATPPPSTAAGSSRTCSSSRGARRTWLDHWAGDGAEPYYRAAAKLYRNDADVQLKSLGADARLAELDKALAEKTGLTLQLAPPGRKGAKTPAVLPITSEQQFALTYRLEAKLPGPGFATVWSEAGPDVKIKAGAMAGERIIQELKDEAAPPVVWTLTSPYLEAEEARPSLAPKVKESSFTVRGRLARPSLWPGHQPAALSAGAYHRRRASAADAGRCRGARPQGAAPAVWRGERGRHHRL